VNGKSPTITENDHEVGWIVLDLVADGVYVTPDAAEDAGAEPDGAEPDGAEPDGAEPDGAVESGGAEPEFGSAGFSVAISGWATRPELSAEPTAVHSSWAVHATAWKLDRLPGSGLGVSDHAPPPQVCARVSWPLIAPAAVQTAGPAQETPLSTLLLVAGVLLAVPAAGLDMTDQPVPFQDSTSVLITGVRA
jgi:hypothetical protein